MDACAGEPCPALQQRVHGAAAKLSHLRAPKFRKRMHKLQKLFQKLLSIFKSIWLLLA